MTGREKFLDFISSMNEFNKRRGYNTFREFICFHEGFDFGILKYTSILDTGSVYVRYSLYFLTPSDEFVVIRTFKDLSIADKALTVLTAI